MAEFDDNDEVARLRQWWGSNATAVIIGIVVAVVLIGGWYAWGWYQNRQAAQAADLYDQISQGVDAGNVTPGVIKAVGQLEDDYSGTPYAAAAALDLAKHYVEKKQYDKAAGQLDWAMNNAANDGVRNIARVRKARVVWSQGQPKAALDLLSADHPASFDALYAELAGDIHAAQGDRKAAYQSYQQALKHLPADMPSAGLQTKLNDNAPADNAGGAPSANKGAAAS